MYQSVLDEIARYMGEMEVPRPMIDGMVATASSEIRWVDYDHDGLSRPPSFAEWADASCGPLSPQEESTLVALRAQQDDQKELTEEEMLLLKLLTAKSIEHDKCNLVLRYSSVDRLAPP
jgi:hypothetical protein